MNARAIAFLATAKPVESRHFYAETFGLNCVEEDDFAIVFDVHGTTLRIQKVHEVSVAPYTSFGLEVQDIDAEVDRLSSNGVRGQRYAQLTQDSKAIWTAPSGARVAWFQDPDGNVVSLTELAR